VGDVRHNLLLDDGEGESAILLGSSQASSSRPSDMSNLYVRALGWLQILACDRAPLIFDFLE
jgi:hypothetical protein